jgi:uncharacterized protein (TIGR00251 family)
VIIVIKVTTQASENKIYSDYVDLLNQRVISVRTTAVPENGKANQAIIKILSGYLKIPKSKMKIIKGQTSKSKIVKIEE